MGSEPTDAYYLELAKSVIHAMRAEIDVLRSQVGQLTTVLKMAGWEHGAIDCTAEDVRKWKDETLYTISRTAEDHTLSAEDRITIIKDYTDHIIHVLKG